MGTVVALYIIISTMGTPSAQSDLSTWTAHDSTRGRQGGAFSSDATKLVALMHVGQIKTLFPVGTEFLKGLRTLTVNGHTQ